jgi:hypothetical protein
MTGQLQAKAQQNEELGKPYCQISQEEELTPSRLKVEGVLGKYEAYVAGQPQDTMVVAIKCPGLPQPIKDTQSYRPVIYVTVEILQKF